MMIRNTVALIAVFGLTACGGGSRYSSANANGGYTGASTPVVQFARGPIQQACQADGRKASSRARCGCIQAVADQTLSPTDQRRGARYFKDPHKLQEVRQSDNAGNERFWLEWKAFGQRAASTCSST